MGNAANNPTGGSIHSQDAGLPHPRSKVTATGELILKDPVPDPTLSQIFPAIIPTMNTPYEVMEIPNAMFNQSISQPTKTTHHFNIFSPIGGPLSGRQVWKGIKLVADSNRWFSRALYMEYTYTSTTADHETPNNEGLVGRELAFSFSFDFVDHIERKLRSLRACFHDKLMSIWSLICIS